MVKTRFIVTCGLLMFCFTAYAYAEDKLAEEASIKAAYLYNFLRFVEWPNQNIIETHICVIGKKQVYDGVFQRLKKQSLNNKQLVIQEFSRYEILPTLTHCRLIFITSPSSQQESNSIIISLKGTNTLTVGEDKYFTEQGGMINFIKQQDKIRFDINLNAVHQTEIRITSKILRIAKRVIQ